MSKRPIQRITISGLIVFFLSSTVFGAVGIVDSTLD